ncbi:MAG: hypothetical protein ACI8Q6_001070 [Granulosicoccus sp.]|jgi:hypothetical protein
MVQTVSVKFVGDMGDRTVSVERGTTILQSARAAGAKITATLCPAIPPAHRYAPVTRRGEVFKSRDILLKTAPNAQIYLLPIIAGFVGADTVSAIIASRLHESVETRLLVDIGTNGEVVMGNRNRLMPCSNRSRAVSPKMVKSAPSSSSTNPKAPMVTTSA